MAETGVHDSIPMDRIEVGEVVSYRDDDIWWRVYDIEGDVVIIGYEKRENSVRKTVPRESVRSAAGYLKALLEHRGVEGLGVVVDSKTGEGNFYPKVLNN
jgi:hypothetical protein